VDNNDPSVKNMGVAAKARGQADWLIGMNGTRAMTLAHNNGSGVMNIGRVLVPTLSIVVRRHIEIANFKPKPYYTPTIKMEDGTILTWNKRFDDGDMTGIDEEGRIVDKAVADEIVRRINAGLKGDITESKSVEKSQEPPLPFSLPSIQSELSRKHGLSVDSITKACQKLYEKKMQSYVGTDCRYLPESQHSEAISVLNGLRTQFPGIIRNTDTSKKYSCWNDKKMSGDGAAAHHAIIPTGIVGMLEGEAERIVFDAVCKRYVAQFYPEYRYLSVALKSTFDKDEFSASARAPISMGWKEIEGDTDDQCDEGGPSNKDKPAMAVKQ
jgi:DNA topoisomerase-3